MPKPNYIFMPLNEGEDPREIEFYIKRLVFCADALTAMRERYSCFEEAQYEARNKDLLCLSLLLDTVEGIIKDIRNEQALRQPSGQRLKALIDVLPPYVVAELMER